MRVSHVAQLRPRLTCQLGDLCHAIYKPRVVFQGAAGLALASFKHKVDLMAMAERLHVDPPKTKEEKEKKKDPEKPGKEDE